MQEEAALAGLSQVFESISPEDLQKLRQAQEMIFRLSDEELADMSDVLDAAMEDPEIRMELEREADMKLPENSLILLNALAKNAMPQTAGYMPRQGMYDGGIASLGRGGDTMLAHITPGEAHLLRSRGGSGTINPYTGQPEFFIKKAVKKLGNAVKKVANAIKPFAPLILSVALPGVGAIVGAIGTAGAAALGSGLGTLIAGGNARQALTAAGMAFAGSAIMGGVGNVMRGGEGTIGQRFMEGAHSYISPAKSLARAETSALRRAAARGEGKEASLWERIRGSGTDAPRLTPEQASARLNDPAFTPAPTLRDSLPSREGGDQQTLTQRLLSQGPEDTRTAGEMWKDAIDPRSGFRGDRAMPIEDALAKVRENPQFRTLPGETQFKLAEKMVAESTPSMLSRFGPLAALGTAGVAAAGGFKEKPADDSAMRAYRAFNEQDAQHRLDNPHLYGGIDWSVPSAGQRGVTSAMLPPSAGEGFTGRVVDPMGAFTAGREGGFDFLSQLYAMHDPMLPPRRVMMRMGGQTVDGLDLPFNNHQLPQTPYGPRIQGPVLGPQRPTDDNIAAALHPNEFVFTTEAVKGAGDGDVNRGIKAMYDLMHRLERRAGGRA